MGNRQGRLSESGCSVKLWGSPSLVASAELMASCVPLVVKGSGSSWMAVLEVYPDSDQRRTQDTLRTVYKL